MEQQLAAAHSWYVKAEAAERRANYLADALREIRDTIVPHPYSPQFLKDIARAALDRQEQR